ncbi:MAG: hypothetical protein K2H38_10015 [Muribaculaceae bacterium]|nr:hypothetical protein [Muribaculaceae bacterium]
MKKTLLSIIALLCVTLGASAMSLKDAYKALSNIPNVSVSSPDYNLPMDISAMPDYGFTLSEGNLATAYNLNAAQIKETGDAAFTILNQVPMLRMINGGSNNSVAGLIYAEPTGENSNDVLIVAMSGNRGSAVFMYVQNVPDTVCTALQMAPVEMKGDYFSLRAKLNGNDEFNIILNKAR